MWASFEGTINRSSPINALPVALIRFSPLAVKWSSVEPVCRPFSDHSVSPWRMMNTRGVVMARLYAAGRSKFNSASDRKSNYWTTLIWINRVKFRKDKTAKPTPRPDESAASEGLQLMTSAGHLAPNPYSRRFPSTLAPRAWILRNQCLVFSSHFPSSFETMWLDYASNNGDTTAAA